MQKVSVEFSEREAEQLADQLVERLDVTAKLRLVEKLERETRRARWQPLVLRMRRRFAQQPLSPLEIRRLCETVRRERYQGGQRRARRR